MNSICKSLLAASVLTMFAGVSLAATPATPAAKTCAEQSALVKAEWDKAPAGAKKDAALTHYTAAENAMKAKNEKECLAHLEEAGKALK